MEFFKILWSILGIPARSWDLGAGDGYLPRGNCLLLFGTVRSTLLALFFGPAIAVTAILANPVRTLVFKNPSVFHSIFI
jgi:hypothetical protein